MKIWGFQKRSGKPPAHPLHPSMNNTNSSVNGSGDPGSAAKESGREALQHLLENHVENLLRMREEKDIRDIDLLSCNRRLRKLPDAEVAAGIASLHGQMRELIGQVAHQIEERNYRSAEEAIREMEVSKHERLQALALIEADKALQVSCCSLKVTVEMFSQMNRWLLDRLSESDSLPAEQERKMLLSNAILAYEITDFCIRFIEPELRSWR